LQARLQQRPVADGDIDIDLIDKAGALIDR